MIIVLLGASGSGKSTIENELTTKHGYEKIVPYTTRAKREDEIDGKDYHFVSYETFTKMMDDDSFATCEKYSQERYYGILEDDYFDSFADNKVVVLTPNGIKELLNDYYYYSNRNIYTVYVNANLGTRMKRYIDRYGTENFNYDDKNEICARVERDFGMFMGMENMVDLVVENNEGANISDIAKRIISCIKEKKKAQMPN